MDFLRDLLVNLIGEYSPPVYYDAVSDLEVIPSGMAGVDWPWVLSAVLLIFVIYSVFRIVRCLYSR